MKKQLKGQLPVIVITGYTFEGLEETVRTQYGVRYFLRKGTEGLQDIHAFRRLIASILEEPSDGDMPAAK
jgi:hypothetical protein